MTSPSPRGPLGLRPRVRADLSRYPDGPVLTYVKEPQARFLVRLRLAEWATDVCGGPRRPLALALRLLARRYGLRLGLTIPPGVVGAGLRLPHVGTIVISGEARVGANCQVLQGVTIGDWHGAPVIGDDVYLGPNCTVLGDVRVGDGAVVAAGAVVTCDVPAGQTWGGVPARPIAAPPDLR